MTKPSIELRRGLEALFYMDERYWDGTKNELKDRSGKRNHASATGGPTVGVQGPREYDAAYFDGTDDLFSFADDETHSGLTEFSIFVVFKIDVLPSTAGRNYELIRRTVNDNAFDLKIHENGDRLEWHVNAGGTWNTVETSAAMETERWYYATALYEDPEMTLRVAGGVDETLAKTHSTGGEVTSSTSTVKIGSDGTAGYTEGWIAVASYWSEKSLSETEIKALLNASGPRRAIA